MTNAQLLAIKDAVDAHGTVQVHYGQPECACTVMTAAQLSRLIAALVEISETPNDERHDVGDCHAIARAALEGL